MKHVYVIRHGESVMNTQGALASRTDTPLTETGREQARAAGEEARLIGIDYIISSPLSRAFDTAQIIAETIEYPVKNIERSDLLVERNFGTAEGEPWSPDFNLEPYAEVESLDSLQERVERLWKYLQTISADTILVSTHGSTGRMLRHVATPSIPFQGTTREHHLPNAHLIKLI